jgi:flagellar hook-basal body complex protein FliE
MTLGSQTKQKIRTDLLLELNSTFTKVSKQYEQHDEADREFLQTLIESIRECVESNTKAPTEFNQ